MSQNGYGYRSRRGDPMLLKVYGASDTVRRSSSKPVKPLGWPPPQISVSNSWRWGRPDFIVFGWPRLPRRPQKHSKMRGAPPPPPSQNFLEGAPGAAGAAQETKIRDASRPQNQVLKTVVPRASEVLFAVSVTDGTVVDRGASLNNPNPEPEV